MINARFLFESKIENIASKTIWNCFMLNNFKKLCPGEEMMICNFEQSQSHNSMLEDDWFYSFCSHVEICSDKIVLSVQIVFKAGCWCPVYYIYKIDRSPLFRRTHTHALPNSFIFACTSCTCTKSISITAGNKIGIPQTARSRRKCYICILVELDHPLLSLL